MKKFIVTIGLFWVSFFSVSTQAATLNLESTASVAPSGSFNVLLKAVSDWQNLKQLKAEKQIALNFEENLTFPSLKEIERVEAELEIVNQKLETLNTQYLAVDEDEAQAVFLDSIDLKQSEVISLTAEKNRFEETYATRKAKQQSSILELTQNLDDLDEDLEKQRSLIQQQFLQTFGQVALVLGLLVLVLILKAISAKVIRRFSKPLSERRQQVLQRLNKIFFNAFLVLILIGTVSSQLASLLPFLALLGTGIAFAVRDALSSFLGWFLIGGENGYRVGQIIRLGDFYGRVHEVTPFLTLIKEIRGDHETGEIVSYPNKVIFEQPISHFSKYMGYVHKELNFLVAEETDIDEAKKILKDCINRVIDQERTTGKGDLSRLVKHYGLSDEDIQPLVWIENNDHGLALRARLLVALSTAAYTKATIEESFIRYAQKSPNINFHYTDSGRNQTFNGEHKADRDADHFH